MDGYAGYNKLEPDAKLCGCWAHLRRKFDEALAVLPQKDVESTAAKGLAYCNKLFEIEKTISEKSSEEIYLQRQEQSKPVAEALFAWTEDQSSRILPKSLTGSAIQYALNQKTKLLRFLEDGRVEVSNNRAERSIKPFVIGRKNWLFCNTPGGADSSAIIYSIIETAKENGLKPFEYLMFLFDGIQKINVSDNAEVDKLLPWADEFPSHFRCSTK